jgi:hypothetical protein
VGVTGGFYILHHLRWNCILDSTAGIYAHIIL